jgi:hypothetical protein
MRSVRFQTLRDSLVLEPMRPGMVVITAASFLSVPFYFLYILAIS